MKRLRLATPEEVEGIRETSDLDPSCIVLALDTQAGTAMAVVRMPVEVDPVYFPAEFSDKLKVFFIRDIETYLSAKGATSYYFNVHAEDEKWIENIKSWGCEQVSETSEIRFKQKL